MMLQVQDLSVRYGDFTVVDKASFSVEAGDWLMVVGPNGAGKSTLVNAIAGGIKFSGQVSFGGTSLSAMSAAARARCLGILSQNHYVGYSFSVEEVVRLGRYAYGKGPLAARPEADSAMVESALEQTGLTELRNHSVLTLSGGELQRTFLAQLFAQDPALLILDEPTNHLDLVYQKQVFALIQNWLRQSGKAVISVVHDLSLARAYGSRALLMDRGRVLAQGPVESVLSPAQLNPVYGMDVPAWMRSLLSQWEEKA